MLIDDDDDDDKRLHCSKIDRLIMNDRWIVLCDRRCPSKTGLTVFITKTGGRYGRKNGGGRRKIWGFI